MVTDEQATKIILSKAYDRKISYNGLFEDEVYYRIGKDYYSGWGYTSPYTKGVRSVDDKEEIYRLRLLEKRAISKKSTEITFNDVPSGYVRGLSKGSSLTKEQSREAYGLKGASNVGISLNRPRSSARRSSRSRRSM